MKNEGIVGPPRLGDSYDNLLDGIETESDENVKRKIGRKSGGNRQQNRQSSVEEGYQNVLKSFESSLQNINSIVNNSKSQSKNKTPKKRMKKETQKMANSQANAMQFDPIIAAPAVGRPKMIHTQKTRVPVEMGTDGVKRGQKTKTLVTKTPKVMPNEQLLAPPAITIPPITGRPTVTFTGERNRPRTKNVSYHIEGRQSFASATFPKPMSQADFASSSANNEMQMADQAPQQQEIPSLEMINIKIEPELQKHIDGNMDHEQHLESNNGFAEPEMGEMKMNFVPKHQPGVVRSTKKRRQVRWTPKRRLSAAAKKSKEQKFLSPPSMHLETRQMDTEQLIQNNMEHACNMDVSDNDINATTSDMHIASNEMTVSASNVTVQETIASEQPPQELFETPASESNHLDVPYETNVTEEVEHTIQESILPDLEKVNHVEELSSGNVKLSVKVEAAHDGILDVHNLIGSVEESVPETIIPDNVEYTCEMCAAVFSTRGELLLHVPVHI